MADSEKKEVTPTPEKDKSDTKKPASPKKDKVSFGQKVAKFFRDYKSELKKIVWPTPKQVVHNTVIVLVTIVVVSTFIGVLDVAFSSGIFALGSLI